MDNANRAADAAHNMIASDRLVIPLTCKPLSKSTRAADARILWLTRPCSNAGPFKASARSPQSRLKAHPGFAHGF